MQGPITKLIEDEIKESREGLNMLHRFFGIQLESLLPRIKELEKEPFGKWTETYEKLLENGSITDEPESDTLSEVLDVLSISKEIVHHEIFVMKQFYNKRNTDQNYTCKIYESALDRIRAIEKKLIESKSSNQK